MREFDVLVVGGGSSGAVIARRLVDQGRQVLLLEAGPDYRSAETPPEVRDTWPLGTLQNEAVFRRFLVPDLLARRTRAQTPWLYWQGRGVGGSSAVNGLFAVRPTVEDLDGWAEATGDAGWSFDACLPTLCRIESDADFPHKSYHGDRGPLPITRPRLEDFQPLESAFGDAAAALGHAWAADMNAPHAKGWSQYPYNAREGRRVSTNDAYLEPVRGSGSLKIVGNALVSRVLFSGSRAVGVLAHIAGEDRTFRAAHVVLSAGVFNSPAILMRSGIGPAQHLRELGIQVLQDLPVGDGLQDHPGISAQVVLTPGIAVEEADRRHCRAVLRFDSDHGHDDLMVGAMNSHGFNTANGLGFGTLVGWLNLVSSRGTVRLSSPDPLVPPRIEFDLLSDPDDMALMRTLVRDMSELLAQPAIAKVAETVVLLNQVNGTTTDAFPNADDPDLEALVLSSVHDVQHATSTCRMGRPDDPESVVDSTGRVHGVEGLTVADASTFPWVPRANTHLSAVLVGEKVAESLLKESAR